MSGKHLNGYVLGVSGLHSKESMDTADQMTRIVVDMVGRIRKYKDLVVR